eukprot:gene13223-14573_t
MPVNLTQINALEKDDPETWNALKSCEFMVAKDQALRQEIKKLKVHGCVVGLSTDEGALDRLVTTIPYLADLVNQYLSTFPKASQASERTEIYQLYGEIAVKSRANVIKLRDIIELHCGVNPLKKKTQLKSLVSSALVLVAAKNDILQFAEKGKQRFEELVSERLICSSPLSV